MRVSNSNNFASTPMKTSKMAKEMFSDELERYEDKVKDRLKNGEPAYNIGMTSITEQDWEDLMENIDSCMQKARELREQDLQQDRQESLESKIYNKLYVRLHEGADN